MTKNAMISMAIRAIKKVMPSFSDARMNPEKKVEYDRWMEVVHWLENLREN